LKIKIDPEYYVKRGRIYVQMGDLSSGIAHFTKAVAVSNRKDWIKELNSLYYVKGMAMIEQGDTTDAVSFIKDLKIEDFKFTYLRALAYVKAGSRELAMEEVDNCLKLEPNNVDAIVLKAKLLWSAGKIEEGNEIFWSAHAIDPCHSEVVEFLSIMRPKADTLYEKAVKSVLEQDYPAALLAIKKGLDAFHDHSKLLLLRASINRLQKEYEKAIDDLELAAKYMAAEGIDQEVNTQIGLTYNDMGKMLFAKKEYNGSVTVFTEAEKYMPKDAGIQINRGDAYRELGNYSLALANYHYALELGGSETIIKTRLALTHYFLGIFNKSNNAKGIACFNKRDYNGAIVEFSRAVDFNPGVADFFAKRGRTYVELKVFCEKHETKNRK